MRRFQLFPFGNIIFYVTTFIYCNIFYAWYKCANFALKTDAPVYFQHGNNWKRIRSDRFWGLL